MGKRQLFQNSERDDKNSIESLVKRRIQSELTLHLHNIKYDILDDNELNKFA